MTCDPETISFDAKLAKADPTANHHKFGFQELNPARGKNENTCNAKPYHQQQPNKGSGRQNVENKPARQPWAMRLLDLDIVS